MNHAIQINLAADNRLERGFSCIWHYLRVNPAIAFEQTKHDGFAASTSPALATNTLGSKIRLIHFHMTCQVGMLFTFLRQTVAQCYVDRVDRADANSGQPGGIRRREIHRKIANNSAKSLLCDSGTAIIPVFGSHFRRLAHIR